MFVKLTNINKKIQIIETKNEYFNALSKHFVESNFHFNSICTDEAF